MSLGDSGFLQFRVVSNDYGKPCEDSETEQLLSPSGDEPEPQAPKRGRPAKKDQGEKGGKKNGKKKDDEKVKKGKKAPEAWLCPLYVNGFAIINALVRG